MTAVWIVACLAAAVLDLWTSRRAIANGGREGNALMRLFRADASASGRALVMGGVLAVYVGLAYGIAPPAQRWWAWVIWIGVHLACAGWNAVQLRRPPCSG